jgi:Domain of unknown function (DUF3883)
MRHFLQYWKVEQADLYEGQPLDHAASAQFGLVHPTDTLWIVTIRDHRLKLLGRLRVAEIVGQQEAERRLGRKPYEGPFHALAEPGTVEPVFETDIQDLAKRLRFDSDREKLKIKKANRTDGRQIQRLRELTLESVGLLAKRFAKRDVTRGGPAYWWVSQNRTWQQESSGGYLWAPLNDKGGRVPFHWASMRAVRPGELVFHYVHGQILAVSVARSVAYRCPRPSEFAKSGSTWIPNGLKVDCSYFVFEKPIRVRNHLGEIRRLLPKKYSPLTKHSKGSELYLVRVPDSLGRLLLKLAGIPALKEITIPETQSSRMGRGGAGFGSYEENKKVETAAISHVRREYRQNGWKVKSVEQDKCGYDLLCSRRGVEEHVEVKGVRGPAPIFTITAAEVRRAARDDRLLVFVVTAALKNPQPHRLTGTAFLKRYQLEPLNFRAEPRKLM